MYTFLQYYGHREKLKLVGREDELEKFNRNALRMAREVADKTGSLMAGNISNTTVFVPEDPESVARCKQVFKVYIEGNIMGGFVYDFYQ